VVTINSFSKTFAMTGLRVGYLWSLDQVLVNTVIEMKSHTSMNTSIIAQEMAYTATTVPKSYVDEQLKIWESRRDIDLQRHEGHRPRPLEARRGVLRTPQDREPPRLRLGHVPRPQGDHYLGEWFGAPDRVRFSYALDVDKIVQGLERVDRYLRSRKKKPVH
jgi:aspartate aminotransferase